VIRQHVADSFGFRIGASAGATAVCQSVICLVVHDGPHLGKDIPPGRRITNKPLSRRQSYMLTFSDARQSPVFNILTAIYSRLKRQEVTRMGPMPQQTRLRTMKPTLSWSHFIHTCHPCHHIRQDCVFGIAIYIHTCLVPMASESVWSNWHNQMGRRGQLILR
jgi:hypothetical protein